MDKRKALAAKQQNFTKPLDAQSHGATQSIQPLHSGALQHAAPSDTFSIQPSILMSGADTLQRRPSGLTLVFLSTAAATILKVCFVSVCCKEACPCFSPHLLCCGVSAYEALQSCWNSNQHQSASIMLQVKGAKSPLGKTSSLADKDNILISSVTQEQQQGLSAVTQASTLPVVAHRAALLRQQQDQSPAELDSAQHVLLQPSPTALLSRPASLRTTSGQAQMPLATAQAKGSAPNVSQTSAQAAQLTHSAFAISPRLRRDPSPAELATAKQKSLGLGDSIAVITDAQAFVLSPRQKRDPSPSELGLIRHQSASPRVLPQHHMSHTAFINVV